LSRTTHHYRSKEAVPAGFLPGRRPVASPPYLQKDLLTRYRRPPFWLSIYPCHQPLHSCFTGTPITTTERIPQTAHRIIDQTIAGMQMDSRWRSPKRTARCRQVTNAEDEKETVWIDLYCHGKVSGHLECIQHARW